MNDFSSSGLQVFLNLVVLIFGGFFSVFLSRFFCVSPIRSFFLYAWHTLFSLIYFYYIDSYGGDATNYFSLSFSEDLDSGFGTPSVVFIASLLTQGFGLSFLGCSLVFQMFGFLGLLSFDGALRQVTKDKSAMMKIIASMVVLLPSISFWSSGLGKDPISFCSMGLALWSSLSLRKRGLILLVAVLAMISVRPHMAGIMVLGLTSSFVIQRGILFHQRVILGTAALIAAIVLVPFGLDYAGVGVDPTASDVMSFVEKRQSLNMHGGGAVDISNMSLPVQMFSYLFRPTLIEANNFFSLAAAFDNTILLFLFVVGCWALIRKPLPAHLADHNRMFLWFYSLGAWLILAMTTANLGIALRQKWMFAPMLIFLLISVIGRSRLPVEPEPAALKASKR